MFSNPALNNQLKDILENQPNSILSSLSNTCTTHYQLFKPTLDQNKTPALYQAVIDDDIIKVKKILNITPKILLQSVPKNFIIESKLTWQQFLIDEKENPLIIAIKRKQMNMIRFLISYYSQLEQHKLIKEALSHWKFYKYNVMNKIIIPQEYVNYAQSLVNVFIKETFPNKKLSEETEVDVEASPNEQLSEETELALSSLFNILLPKQPVKLDDYLDTELLLHATYETYKEKYHSFNEKQRNAFSIRVFGLILTTLQPEMGKFFCYSLADVYNQIIAGKEILFTDKAMTYQFKAHKVFQIYVSFYRSARDEQSGAGFEYLCGFYGGKSERWLPYFDFDNIYLAKEHHFRKIVKSINSCSQSPINHSV